MNSGSSRWGSNCSSIAHFQWYRTADVSHFCCLFLIFCVFRPIVNSDKNALNYDDDYVDDPVDYINVQIQKKKKRKRKKKNTLLTNNLNRKVLL